MSDPIQAAEERLRLAEAAYAAARLEWHEAGRALDFAREAKRKADLLLRWKARPAPMWASDPRPGEWRVVEIWPGSIRISDAPDAYGEVYSRRTGYLLRMRSGPRIDVAATLAWEAWRTRG